MNGAQLIGRLTKNVELIKTETGTSVGVFTLAVKNGIGKDGNQVPPEYIRIKCFGNLADVCFKYLTKGYLVCVTGKIHTGSYKHKNYDLVINTFEIIATNVEFLRAPKEIAEEDLQEEVTENEVGAFEGGDINEQEN